METFYDGDLKDMWESELDPTQSLKISADSYINEWFQESKFKDYTVILNDKLMSDALLNGTFPIKSEHSYSLNSEGDSMPESPTSLKAKINDIKDECFPAISPKSVTQNHHFSNEQLPTGSSMLSVSPPDQSLNSSCLLSGRGQNSLFDSHMPPANGLISRIDHHNNKSFHRLASLVKTYNLYALENEDEDFVNDSSSIFSANELQTHNNEKNDSIVDNDWSASTASEDNEGSASSEFSSDVEIDECCVKDEPMTPVSSCPPSPEPNETPMVIGEISNNPTNISLNMGHSNFKNADTVFEHKNGCLQLTPASQQILKTQNINLKLAIGATTPNVISATSATSLITTGCVKNKNLLLPQMTTKTISNTFSNKIGGNQVAFNLPHTTAESVYCEETESNIRCENLKVPTSPKTSNVMQRKPQRSCDLKKSTMVLSPGSSIECEVTMNGGCNGANTTISPSLIMGNNNTRQPINTPLISSQPKGSTGLLVLTEEEKRTLLAEGYPIPQQLPLSKAEEKSLKKIRRKIKNKISAQESRRKKKEYMDQLERRVENLVNVNEEYKKRIEVLENSNNSLMDQLRKLQNMIAK